MTREEKLENLGYSLSFIPKPAANYCGVVVNGTTAYVSGCLALKAPGELTWPGKLGSELDVVDAQKAAALCSANILRLLKAELGDLRRIVRAIRLGVFVHGTPDFTESHLVANGASDLMLSVLGEAGRHARSAVCVAQLPLGASVEVDAIFEVSSE